MVRIEVADLLSRIEDRGFDAEIVSSDVARVDVKVAQVVLATTVVSVGGMTCGACTAAVDGGFKGVEGITDVAVSLITERAVIVHDPNLISAEKIVDM